MLQTFRSAALFLVLALAFGGCGIVGGDSPTPTPSSTPTKTSTPTQTPTATPTSTPTPAPGIDATSLSVAQGGATVLRVSGVASSAAATFAGRTFTLLPMPGGFWGMIGVDADDAAGAYPLTVVFYDASGAALLQLDETVTVSITGYPVEAIDLPPDRSGLLDPALAADEAATRERVFSTFTPEQLWSGAFIYPVGGGISSPYGIGRSYNGGPVTGFHSGADFIGDEGTPVGAANAGRVAFVGALPIRGNSVIIDHGLGVFSAYHHLQAAAVSVGQPVAAGDLVGYLGGSGLSTGPHLHWEVIVHGSNVDPVLWTFEPLGP